MLSLLPTLLPLVIGSAAVPMLITMSLLLLKSPNQGILKGGLFIGGMTIARLIEGLAFGYILTARINLNPQKGQSNEILSTVLLVLGIVLLIAAFQQSQHKDDPDAPPPKWLNMMDHISPLLAFVIGFAFVAVGVKAWVFTLSAVAVIDTAPLGDLERFVMFLVFVALAESPFLIPFMIRITMPEKSSQFLEGMSEWIAYHNRIIVVAISLVFGLYFLAHGLYGLML